MSIQLTVNLVLIAVLVSSLFTLASGPHCCPAPTPTPTRVPVSEPTSPIPRGRKQCGPFKQSTVPSLTGATSSASTVMHAQALVGMHVCVCVYIHVRMYTFICLRILCLLSFPSIPFLIYSPLPSPAFPYLPSPPLPCLLCPPIPSPPLSPLPSHPLPRASFGTTKYCTFFLRGSQCSKLDCMYLHELGEEEASFTKEDMQQG